MPDFFLDETYEEEGDYPEEEIFEGDTDTDIDFDEENEESV